MEAAPTSESAELDIILLGSESPVELKIVQELEHMEELQILEDMQPPSTPESVSSKEPTSTETSTSASSQATDITDDEEHQVSAPMPGEKHHTIKDLAFTTEAVELKKKNRKCGKKGGKKAQKKAAVGKEISKLELVALAVVLLAVGAGTMFFTR